MRPPRAMRVQSAQRRIMNQATGNLRGRTPIAALAGRYGVSMDILGSFREWVNQRMDEKCLTHRDLADKAHISLSTVNRLLHGDAEVYLSTAVKVLEALL